MRSSPNASHHIYIYNLILWFTILFDIFQKIKFLAKPSDDWCSSKTKAAHGAAAIISTQLEGSRPIHQPFTIPVVSTHIENDLEAEMVPLRSENGDCAPDAEC